MDEVALYQPPDEFVRKIVALSRDGLSRAQIHKWAREVPEPPSDQAIDAAIAQAAIDLAAAAAISSDVEAGRSISRLHDLYARLHELGDLRGCLAVQKELTKMLGLTSDLKAHSDRRVETVKKVTMEIVGIAEDFIPAKDSAEFIRKIRDVLKRAGLI